MKLTTRTYRSLADTLTPVGIYLKLRDLYPKSILLESNLNDSREKSHSYICLNPIASFVADSHQIRIVKDGHATTVQTDYEDIPDALDAFISDISVEGESPLSAVYGHTSYDGVQCFETIRFKEKELSEAIPLMNYSFYKYVIAIDHFTNQIEFVEFLRADEVSGLENLISQVHNLRFSSYEFKTTCEESSFTSSQKFLNQVEEAKDHCKKGNIFQIVISRRFKQEFQGDEFQVYRALRSINPSPYLYYFDMGNYKIFGSSPEAQIVIKEGKAVINPIAGTYKRTGDLAQDRKLAEALLDDPKENAEHVMLVDLARNDLGRVTNQVSVDSFKDIHYYSHVIHMVSEVSGELPQQYSPIKVLGDSFPAGTLSGAPKYKAMQLIDEFEPVARNYYGGGIGYIDLNGQLNHAIMIRSMLSKDNQLHFQAGAGIVVKSDADAELKEIDNKVGALRHAITQAEELS